MYLFLLAAITGYHRLGGLKQETFSQFWRLEVRVGSCLGLWGRIGPMLSSELLVVPGSPPCSVVCGRITPSLSLSHVASPLCVSKGPNFPLLVRALVIGFRTHLNLD